MKDPVLKPGQAGTYNGYPVIKGTKEPVSRMAETHALLPTGAVETDPNGHLADPLSAAFEKQEEPNAACSAQVEVRTLALQDSLLRRWNTQMGKLPAKSVSGVAGVDPSAWVPPKGETDPNGLAPHVVGAKLDSGKNRLGLVLGDFANALEQVGWIGTGGAAKYTPHGWLSVENGQERYTDAMLRHIIKHCKGEKADPDTKLLHLAHAAWNALAVLELELRKSIPAR